MQLIPAALLLVAAVSAAEAAGCQKNAWKPTLHFEPGRHFYRTDGAVINYSGNVVTRFVDVDGDGKLDMLTANQGRVWLHLGTGDGKFKEKTALLFGNGDVINTGIRENKETTFAYVDLNKDGIQDIVMPKYKNLYVYMGRGFYTSGVLIFQRKRHLRSVESNRFDLTDFDQDGHLDIVIGTFEGKFKLYRNMGNLQFEDAVTLEGIPLSPYNPFPRLLDINGDCKLEIVYSINWGHFSILQQASTHTYREYKLMLVNGSAINVRSKFKEYQAPEMADVDADGVVDLITSGETGDIVFFRGVDIVSKAQNKIVDILLTHTDNLGNMLNNNDTVYNSLYDNNRLIQNHVNNVIIPEKGKTEIFDWYLRLFKSFPQYFFRQHWKAPSLPSFAAYNWLVALESMPTNGNSWKLLSIATNHTGFYAKILEERGIILLNNDREPDQKVKLIYNYLIMKDPAHYSVSLISQKCHLTGKGSKYSSIRDSAINIFCGAEWATNQFPSDCRVCARRQSSSMTFLAVLAHEISHNELDQPKAELFNQTLFKRKFEIIKRATVGHVIWKDIVEQGYDLGRTQEHFRVNKWWDSSEEWEDAWERHFSTGSGRYLYKNSIRPIGIHFFVKAPQEAFATLANEYATNSKLMLDFAVERAKDGHPISLDWFLLIANYYSAGGDTTPMFSIKRNGDMTQYDAKIKRDRHGWINKIYVDPKHGFPGPCYYAFRLDKDGFVVSVICY